MSTAAPKTTAVTTRKELKVELQGDAFRRAVAQVLPKHLTADRFVRIAILAMTRTPKLAQCDKASFFNALMSLSQFGLEPDGRRAHLIPFENRKRGVVECQLIVDWKGLAELAMRSGLVSYLHADVVSDGDKFEYNAGQITSHIPWFIRRDAEKPSAPGEVFAAYAIARFKDGSSKAEVLSLTEVEAVRDGSQGYKQFKAGFAKSSPWESHFFEMAKKTAFRRLSKWLPLSPEFRDAVDLDDKTDPVLDVEAFAAPAAEIPETSQDEGTVVDAEIPEDFSPAPANPAPEPEQSSTAQPTPSTPQEELAMAIIEGGYNFSMFQVWCQNTGNVKDADSLGSFEELPTETATRLLRAKKGLLTQLANIKATGRTQP